MHNSSIISFSFIKNRQLILYNAFLIRLFFVFILAIIYYSYHWNYLVNFQGNILAWMYRSSLGIDTIFILPNFTGSLYNILYLGKACLYIEMYAYIIPFLYDTKKRAWKNIVIILFILIVIQIINFLRVFAIVWISTSYDVPRWLYHDLPDTLIWYPICIGIMVYGSFKFHPISAKIEKIDKDKKES